MSVVPLVLASAASVHAATLSITNDTYLDTLNTDVNYGGSPAVKAVSNGASSPSSLVHGLFKLPDAFWSQIGTGTITDPVTISFYARNNSLKNMTASPAGPIEQTNGARQIELHPLTESYVAGNGGAAGTPVGNGSTNNGTDTMGGSINGQTVNGVPTYFGTDWSTTNGQTRWLVAGGTYDSAQVLNSPIITASSAKSLYITWDISPLLNNSITRDEIYNNGLLMKVTDETSYRGNEFASMVSAESNATAGTYFGLGPTVTFTPEPGSLCVFGGAMMLAWQRRARR